MSVVDRHAHLPVHAGLGDLLAAMRVIPHAVVAPPPGRGNT